MNILIIVLAMTHTTIALMNTLIHPHNNIRNHAYDHEYYHEYYHQYYHQCYH